MTTHIDLIRALRIRDAHAGYLDFPDESPLQGVPVRNIIRMYRASAWDYPSFLMCFLDHCLGAGAINAPLDVPIDPPLNDDDLPMHPTDDDLAAWQSIDPTITSTDLDFDT